MTNEALKNDLEEVKSLSITNIDELYQLSVELYNTNSTKEKTKLLKEFVNNTVNWPGLKSLWRLMFNDFYRYGITEKYILDVMAEHFGGEATDLNNEEYCGRGTDSADFLKLITCLERYLNGEKAKKATAIDICAIIYRNCNEKVIDLFMSILKRDWGVGVTGTTFNKLFGEPFIPVFSVTKALEITIDDLDNLGEDDDYFFIETKYDGTRDFTIVPYECNSKEDIYTLSSNGRVLYIPAVQNDLWNYLEYMKFAQTGFVLDGELTVKDSILSEDRGAVTGWHTSAIKLADGMNSKLDKDWSKNVSFNMFDIVDLNDFENNIPTDIPLIDRKKDLEAMMIAVDFNCIKLGEYDYCSKAELKAKTQLAYDKILAKGGEGLIVKDALCSYSYDRDNSYWWKVKPNSLADLKVIGYQLSDDPKLPGAMGALICQTECETITVEVGSGFSIYDRGYYRLDNEDGTFEYLPIPYYNIDNWIGKIIELKYFGVTHTKTKKNNSLFLPRVELFSKRKKYNTDYMAGDLCAGIVRYDKNEANYAKDLKGYSND